MGDEFKRTARFAFGGIILVAALSLLIGGTLGQGDDPTLAMALILAIGFTFTFLVMRRQRGDLDAVEARAMQDAALGPQQVVDPGTADPLSLLSALAVRPIDERALKAAGETTYALARSSYDAGVKMIVLIALAVVPWQLFQFAWSLVVMVPVIVIYALYLAYRALAGLDEAYEATEATLAPLGLRLTERPEVEVVSRPTGEGARADVSGAVEYAGRRHGRGVTVRHDEDGTTTSLSGRYPEFEITAKGERLRAAPGVPPGVDTLLDGLSASPVWRGVKITGGRDGITVARPVAGAQHWMRDLWLAERLAEAA